MTDHSPAKYAKACIGMAVVITVAFLLLRAAFADIFAHDQVAWVNPNWARAGLGFAALGLVVVVGGAAELWAAISRKVFVGALVTVPIVVLIIAPAVTRAIARSNGFTPCPKLDKFHAGNVSRNDTTLTAFTRAGACIAPASETTP